MGNNVSDSFLKTEIKTVAGSIKSHEFTWLVNGFFSSTSGAGKRFSTEKFTSEIGNERDTWHIILYPHGFNHRVEGFVSLWLKKFTDNERLVDFSCAILNSEFKQIIKKTTHRKLALESTLGWTTFCKRTLIENDKTVLRNGRLVLYFTMNIFSNEDIPNPALEEYDPDQGLRSHDMCNYMKKLLEDGTFSDLIIVVGKSEFHVHKAILSARSDVFSKMLNARCRDMDRIEIGDMSKECVKEMLHFIYTGRLTEEVTEGVLCDLFYAADKYELWFLKKICSITVANILNTDNVLRILLVADQHNAFKLKDKCIRYISRNSLEIQKQTAWYDLIVNQPDLVNSVVESFIKVDN